MIIAIDGPAGTGKSTIAKLISQKLNITFLNSGSFYRGITLALLRENIDITDEQKVLDFAERRTSTTPRTSPAPRRRRARTSAGSGSTGTRNTSSPNAGTSTARRSTISARRAAPIRASARAGTSPRRSPPRMRASSSSTPAPAADASRPGRRPAP